MIHELWTYLQIYTYLLENDLDALLLELVGLRQSHDARFNARLERAAAA